ncbi:MAG: metallophosphoesterase [Alteromonadaceae bacterium]|nr:MAG: metallophosphoesterase [Alteromonadaceae bacterium]
MRIFALSDIHVDYAENADWLSKLSLNDYQQDALILAGDVCESFSGTLSCLELLKNKFRYVFFVPGNHDLWLEKGGSENSIEKFDKLIQSAQAMDVITQRCSIGEYLFVPLWSWYDYSFGPLTDYLKLAWMDFNRCRWPSELASAADISEYFLAQNAIEPVEGSYQVISFSHFLPRIDVMPDFIPMARRNIYPVLGSASVDLQVRQLGSSTHIYGHSHVNRDVVIDGVRYINNAFAYPSESRIARKRLFNILPD